MYQHWYRKQWKLRTAMQLCTWYATNFAKEAFHGFPQQGRPRRIKVVAVQNCPAACLHRWTELQQGLHDSVATAITEKNWSSIATAGQASGSSSSPWLHISSQPSWKVAFPQIFHRFPITCVLIPPSLWANCEAHLGFMPCICWKWTL